MRRQAQKCHTQVAIRDDSLASGPAFMLSSSSSSSSSSFLSSCPLNTAIWFGCSPKNKPNLMPDTVPNVWHMASGTSKRAVIIPFYRKGSLGSEGLDDLSKVTQLLVDDTWIWIQFSLTWNGPQWILPDPQWKAECQSLVLMSELRPMAHLGGLVG